MFRRALFFLSPKKKVATTTATATASSSSAAHRHHHASSGATAASTSKAPAGGKIRFDASKAGLQMVDKEHVQRVIQEASEGSPFYKKEQQKELERNAKIEKLLKKSKYYDEKVSAEEKSRIKKKVDAFEAELEAARNLKRRYIHLDMDMFYAAVEEKKDPQLKHVPFAVGNNTMLSTSNYIARQYGVRSGMPGFIARKLCPELKIIPTDFKSYEREANIIRQIAMVYDPYFVSIGLDELTMDVTDYMAQFYEKNKYRISAEKICTSFREEVLRKTGLTCSGGVAPTSVLAKIASNMNKPNGQHIISLPNNKEVIQYMKKIPLRQIPGIGFAQEQILNALGVKTCGDFLTHKYRLCYLFTEKTFLHYLSVGLGVAETKTLTTQRKNNIVALQRSGSADAAASPVKLKNLRLKDAATRKSIGKESSFSDPLPSREALKKLFRKILEKCHQMCVRDKIFAKQIKLVLKYRNYDTVQFSMNMERPNYDLKMWLEAGNKLLQPHLEEYGDLRLVGVRLQQLVPMDVYYQQLEEQKQASAKAKGAPAVPVVTPAVAAILPIPGAVVTGPAKKGKDVEDDFGDPPHPREHHKKYVNLSPSLNQSGKGGAGGSGSTVASKKKQVKKAAAATTGKNKKKK